MHPHLIGAALLLMATASLAADSTRSSTEDDRRAVAALDTQYQQAVKDNDAQTMASILHEDFVLVLGNGSTYTREDLLEEARSGKFVYERQDEDAGTQTVRVWGDTAVITAKLWLKGVHEGVTFDHKLWFSDTYVRTSHGWRYVFGQASLSLPKSSQAQAETPARGVNDENAKRLSSGLSGSRRIRRASAVDRLEPCSAMRPFLTASSRPT